MSQTADVLRELAETGSLTASRLVAEAASTDHPLHSRFQWDNTLAGHEYRLIQARQLIVSVVERPAGSTRPIPVFIHVRSPAGEGEYVASEFLVQQPGRWELAKTEALRYLKGAEDNVAAMSELMRLRNKIVKSSHDAKSLHEASGLIRRARTKLVRA